MKISFIDPLGHKKPALEHFVKAEVGEKSIFQLSDTESLGIIYNIFGSSDLDEFDKFDLTHQFLSKLPK